MKNHFQIEAIVLIALLSLAAGCSSAEKENPPLVSVEITAATKTSISQTVTAEGVVFPLQQATVAPKITSTIVDFKIQRETRLDQSWKKTLICYF